MATTKGRRLVDQPGAKKKKKDAQKPSYSSTDRGHASGGVTLTSRWGLPAEEKVLARMLSTMAPNIRRLV